MNHTQLLQAMKLMKKENLSTYFLLPLIGLNKLRFGGDKNFLNSYLSRDGLYIYVEVMEPMFEGTNLPDNKVYIGPTGHFYFEFKTPEKWLSDVLLFIEGKYSKFSELAKMRIRDTSGLEYMVGQSKKTDVRLLGLETFPKLKETLTELIYDDRDAVTRNEIGDELLSSPEEQCFLNVELVPVELTKTL